MEPRKTTVEHTPPEGNTGGEVDLSSTAFSQTAAEKKAGQAIWEVSGGVQETSYQHTHY